MYLLIALVDTRFMVEGKSAVAVSNCNHCTLSYLRADCWVATTTTVVVVVVFPLPGKDDYIREPCQPV